MPILNSYSCHLRCELQFCMRARHIFSNYQKALFCVPKQTLSYFRTTDTKNIQGLIDRDFVSLGCFDTENFGQTELCSAANFMQESDDHYFGKWDKKSSSSEVTSEKVNALFQMIAPKGKDVNDTFLKTQSNKKDMHCAQSDRGGIIHELPKEDTSAELHMKLGSCEHDTIYDLADTIDDGTHSSIAEEVEVADSWSSAEFDIEDKCEASVNEKSQSSWLEESIIGSQSYSNDALKKPFVLMKAHKNRESKGILDEGKYLHLQNESNSSPGMGRGILRNS